VIDPSYYQSPHWLRIRLEVLARADYKCADCGQHRSWLHVHHLTYARLGAERLKDLQALCPSCHAKRHPHRALEILAERRVIFPARDDLDYSDIPELDYKDGQDALEELTQMLDEDWSGEGDDPPM